VKKVLTMKDRSDLLTRAQVLLNTKPFSKQTEAEFARTMQLVDLIDDETRHERAQQTVQQLRHEERDTRALRLEEEFRHFVHRPFEKRTYQALETDLAPGTAVVPQSQWLREYTARLISASGWLRAGATLHQTGTNGVPYVSFFSTDTNSASIVAENSVLPEVNPTFTAPTPAVKAFATSVSVSNQLKQDSQIGDLDSFLQTVFSLRVGKALNTFATNDATNGLLAQLNVGATTVSTTLPTLGELVDMQSRIDPAYLEADSQPVYMMSQSLRNLLLKQTATSGNLQYPEIKKNQLLGLPLVINVDMTANPGDVAVVAGSVKRAVLIQSVSPVFIRSVERLAEFNQTLYGMVHRLGVKLIDSAATTSLKLA
jgi:HK97 family phage major capsid protein